MNVISKIVGYVLMAGVMFAAGIWAVKEFGSGVELPPGLENAGYFLGGAGAIYWIWSIFADGLAAWREAGGIGFTVKFIRNIAISMVRSIVAPALAGVAAVSGSWALLKEVGESHGPTIQALATGAIMLGGASLAIITRLPETEPKKAKGQQSQQA